jgi:hypothetical protein
VKNFRELSVKCVHNFATQRLGARYLKYLPIIRPEGFACQPKPGFIGSAVTGDYEKITSMKFNKKIVLYNRSAEVILFWGGEAWLFEGRANFESTLNLPGVLKAVQGSISKYKRKISDSSIGIKCTRCLAMDDLPTDVEFDLVKFESTSSHSYPRVWLLNLVNS